MCAVNCNGVIYFSVGLTIFVTLRGIRNLPLLAFACLNFLILNLALQPKQICHSLVISWPLTWFNTLFLDFLFGSCKLQNHRTWRLRFAKSSCNVRIWSAPYLGGLTSNLGPATRKVASVRPWTPPSVFCSLHTIIQRFLVQAADSVNKPQINKLQNLKIHVVTILVFYNMCTK